jgi:beta-xylosidase
MSFGSLTFFTRGGQTQYSLLAVEGELNPLWLDEEGRRLAVEALRKVEPAYPFINLERPLEATLRGPLWARQQAGQRLFGDEFDGKLDPAWQILRSDPSHWSLEKKPGTLTLTTQKGAMSGSQKNFKNIFLIDSPAPEKDFDITTRILSFQPSVNYQQAGLVCFDDEDNYIKASFEGDGDKLRLVLMREVAGQGQPFTASPAQKLSTVWLRLRKRGSLYTLLASADGELFTPYLQQFWGDGRPKRLGLLAKNAGAVAPEIDAAFDFFEVRSRPEAAR